MTLFKTPSGAHYVLETGMRIGPVTGKGFEISGQNSTEWCEYRSEMEAELNRSVLIGAITNPGSSEGQGFHPELARAIITSTEGLIETVKPTRGRPRKAE